MSRQDKATTERNARILRDLVKQPDNKSCADCRKNDARWASWNLGVFLCIRCSGIHRSMGTHISKVKSIDLDIWTPEQMDSVQKWGNKRANLYWEKHLKAGHVPPDHKIESFIRSKYESRRWAMDGPPPPDPASLENGSGSAVSWNLLYDYQIKLTPEPAVDTSTRPTPTTSAPPPAAAAKGTHPLLSRTAKPAPTPAAPIVDLFGGDDIPPAPAPTARPTAAPTSAPPAAPAPTVAANAPAPTAAPAAPPAQPSNLFDLDFRTPTPSSAKQTAKADIMSLFSSSSPSAAPPAQSFFAPPQAQNAYASWGGGGTSSAAPVQQAPTQTPLGGGWGMQADQNAWGAPAQQQPQQQPQQQQSQYGQYGQQASGAGHMWGGNTSAQVADPWSSTTQPSNGFGLGAPVQAKKEEVDPFANIWK